MADSSNAGGGMEDAKNETKELLEIVTILKDSFLSLGQIITRDIVGNLHEANEETRDLGKILSNQIKSGLRSLGKDSQSMVENAKMLSEGLLKSSDVQKQLNQSAKTYSTLLTDIEISLRNNVIDQAQALNYALKIEEAYTAQNDQLAQQFLKAYKIEQTMGNLGKIFKGLTKIPIVGQLIDAEKVTKRMQQAAADGASKWKTFGVGIKATFASIGDSLTDPLTIITGLYAGISKLVKLAADYQSKQFEAAKDLGVSVERGKELRDNFLIIARSNLGLAVTADQLQKSYAGVQDQLGIIVKQSDEFNQSSTLIERRTGATAENMATLQFAAGKMGTSLMEAYRSIEGSAKVEGGRVKLAMSEKQILEGISKVSATVYQNFKGNYKELAAAVVESKKLGLSLEQINGTQDQFLDFESSIAKQFEAEVLTGRDLNLTRARELALAHDTKGLMEEMTKQLGSQNEWNNLNTIQQQSLAASLGLSRDAVNQMYMDQEKAKVLGESAGQDLKTQYDYLVAHKTTKEEIVRLLGQEGVASAQQASVSEKLAATMDTIKNSIAQASTILLPMIEKVAGWLANTENLKKVFIGIAALMGTMVGYSLAMKAAGMAQVASQISLLQIQIAQGVNMQKALVTQGLLAEETIVTAAAATTAGSAYLGPGAIAVGAAVIAALGAYVGMSAMGSPSVPKNSDAEMAAGSAAYMAEPVNTAAAMATTQTAAPSQQFNAIAPAQQQMSGKVYLDSHPVGSIIFGDANQQYGITSVK